MQLSLEQQCLLQIKDTQITSAKDVYDIFKDFMEVLLKEFFVALYLNTKNYVINAEIISIGTLNKSLVHPREVFRRAIIENAHSVILVHNHPSGDAKPSQQDVEITKTLMKASKIIGIELLDHVIIGAGKFWSFKEKII